MKKSIFLLVLVIIICMVLLSGCLPSDPLQEQYTTTVATEAATTNVTENIDAGLYDNNIDGLIKYLTASKYFSDKETNNKVTMSAKLIGAEQGYKIPFNFSGSNCTIEIYSYNNENLTEEAKAVINSVQTEGKFSLFEFTAVEASLLSNNKYLVIYNDPKISTQTANNEENIKRKSQIFGAINDFHNS